MVPWSLGARRILHTPRAKVRRAAGRAVAQPREPRLPRALRRGDCPHRGAPTSDPPSVRGTGGLQTCVCGEHGPRGGGRAGGHRRRPGDDHPQTPETRGGGGEGAGQAGARPWEGDLGEAGRDVQAGGSGDRTATRRSRESCPSHPLAQSVLLSPLRALSPGQDGCATARAAQGITDPPSSASQGGATPRGGAARALHGPGSRAPPRLQDPRGQAGGTHGRNLQLWARRCHPKSKHKTHMSRGQEKARSLPRFPGPRQQAACQGRCWGQTL